MLRRLINGLVDIIYPKVCLACKNKLGVSGVDNLICVECWAKIKKNLPPFCHSCGRKLEKSAFIKNICPACLKIRFHFDRAFSPCMYEGVIKNLIHEFKYNRKDYLGPILSKPMTEFIKEYNIPINYIDFIIPMPLHKARLREREFNQAQVLAKFISQEFKKDMLGDTLYRHRYTKTQTDLQIKDRFFNVKGSFSVNKHPDLKGKNLLLIDDVLTTGATSSEAAKTLKDAGANIVFVLTLAN
jgi:ComF family protein